MHNVTYEQLKNELIILYSKLTFLSEFAPLPDKWIEQQVLPTQRDVSFSLQSNTELMSSNFSSLRDTLVGAAPIMHWLEIYKESDIQIEGVSCDFMEHLGVYTIIGDTGPFQSQNMSVYLVYMPAGLTYPWHYHPAEELYFIISGEAVFRRDGHEDVVASEGMHIIHETNQPHEIQTYDKPMLSLALWRNHLDVVPTLIAR